MDADIKALENAVAKINPPPHSHPVLYTKQLSIINPCTNLIYKHASQTVSVPTSYGPIRGPSHSANANKSAPYHPYNHSSANHNKSASNNALLQQQIAATQLQAVRLQAQAAAINAARTRTLMSAAAQAQAARNAAIHKASVYSGGPNKLQQQNEAVECEEFGPSMVKNKVYSKYNQRLSANYKRYDYEYDKRPTVPTNSSLYNLEVCGSKPMKKRKLKATHQYQLRTAANEQWVDQTMTSWAENDFRIFCGDLGNEVSDAMLTSAFSKYPSFAKAKVVRDKRTGKSKGYGFVSFLEPNDFIRAFKEMNGKYVGNRPIKLRRSKWKDRMKKVKNFKIRE